MAWRDMVSPSLLGEETNWVSPEWLLHQRCKWRYPHKPTRQVKFSLPQVHSKLNKLELSQMSFLCQAEDILEVFKIKKGVIFHIWNKSQITMKNMFQSSEHSLLFLSFSYAGCQNIWKHDSWEDCRRNLQQLCGSVEGVSAWKSTQMGKQQAKEPWYSTAATSQCLYLLWCTNLLSLRGLDFSNYHRE